MPSRVAREIWLVVFVVVVTAVVVVAGWTPRLPTSTSRSGRRAVVVVGPTTTAVPLHLPLDHCTLPFGSRLGSSHSTLEDQGGDPADSSSIFFDGGGGALSRTVDELAVALGGRGRARLAWDLYCIGVDPALQQQQEQPDNENDNNDTDSIHKLLPRPRRTQRLGTAALTQLAQLHQQHCHGVSCVEGGVAQRVHTQTSRDGTTKLLLQLHDRTLVETVIIPWNDHRSTLCISSQVGCRQACQFCATGKMGRVRSLSTDEILAQMFFAQQWCRLQGLPPVSNVVFMGMVRVCVRV